MLNNPGIVTPVAQVLNNLATATSMLHKSSPARTPGAEDFAMESVLYSSTSSSIIHTRTDTVEKEGNTERARRGGREAKEGQKWKRHSLGDIQGVLGF